MTRSKKAKLARKRAVAKIEVLFRGGRDGEFADEVIREALGRSVKLEPTRRNPRPLPNEHLAREGARRLVPLRGVSLTKERAPRRHSLCGRVHAPGKCSLVALSMGHKGMPAFAPGSIADAIEERWLADLQGELDGRRAA